MLTHIGNGNSSLESQSIQLQISSGNILKDTGRNNVQSDDYPAL
jgi:hypothetical protein